LTENYLFSASAKLPKSTDENGDEAEDQGKSIVEKGMRAIER